jgi:hypothetical protein
MASKGPNTAPEEALMKARTELTYNYQLWAYDARIEKRVKNQVIRLNSKTAKGRWDAVQDAYTASNGTHVVCTEEELKFDMDDENLLTAVVVGMRPSCSPAKDKGNAELLGPSEKVESVQSLKINKTIDHEANALRVVCLRFGQNAVFYALTNRDKDTGLCEAVIISAKEVFFFPEFRNDTIKDLHTRKHTWGEKVRAMMMGKTASKQKPGDKISVSLERNLSTNLASF